MRRNLLLPILMITWSCGPKKTELSHIKHDAGRFVSSSDPLQWVAIDDDRWQAQEVQEGQAAYSIKHPMTLRLQAWADEIRRNMLKSSPELAAAPQPVIRIIQSDDVNAYVAGQPMCIDAPILTWSEAEREYQASENYLVAASGFLNAMPPGNCVHVEGDLATKKRHVEFALRSKAGCEVAIDEESEYLLLSPQCVTPSMEGFAFKGLTYDSVHNHVTVYSALLSSSTEAEMVGVLAHELGHYYMSHGTALEQDYNYLYEIKAQNSEGKPPRLPADHVLNQLAALIKALPIPFYTQIKDQDLHSYLYLLIRNLRFALANSSDVCRSLADHLGNDYEGHLGSLPYDLPTSDAARAAYFRYEAESKACLSGMKASAIQSLSLSSLIRGQFIATPAAVDDEDALSFLRRAEAAIKTTVADLEARHSNLMNLATSSGLGWYTVEQEADDIGTEMLVRLGFDPLTLVEFNVKSAEREENDAGCREQYQAGFPNPVSLGNLDEIHHAYCFRAYNSLREIKAHQEHFAAYKEFQTPVVQPELTWDAALETLQRLD